MRQRYIFGILLISILVFSGCSLVPSNTSTTSTKTYSISQSLWKSTDGGKNWSAKDKSAQKPRISDVNVLSFAINSRDSGNIYVGLRSGGIMSTKDGGENWEFSKIFTSEKVYGLALDPTDGKNIYASAVFEGRGKIFKSEDAGENWTEIYTSASDGPLIIFLSLDKKNPKNIYAATSDNQVIKSSDGGVSWRNIYQTSQPVIKIAIDSANSNQIYFLSTDGTLFRSRDGGDNLEDIKKNFSQTFSMNQNFSVLETSPTYAGSVYLAGQGGIIKSEDGGDSWKKIIALSDPDSFPVTALAVNPKNSNEIIYGAGQAAFKSIDGGANWSTSQFGIQKKIRFIEYDPNNSETVYLGFDK